MAEQISKLSYVATSFFTTPVVEEAARILVDSTGGQMTRAYIVNSGQTLGSALIVYHKGGANCQ